MRVQLTRLVECQTTIIEEKQVLEAEISRAAALDTPAKPRPVPASAFRRDGVAHFHQQSADCHFLLISIRHVLRILRERREEDARLAASEDQFQKDFPGAQDLRDILEHLDEYEAGIGWLHNRGLIDPNATALFLLYESGIDPGGELFLHFGPGARVVPLKAAADAAIGLAGLLEEIEHERETVR